MSVNCLHPRRGMAPAYAPPMTRSSLRSLAILPLLVALGAAGACDSGEEVTSEENDQIEGLGEGSPAALSVLSLVNDRTLTADGLRTAAKIDSRAAKNIVAHREGADAAQRTEDDDLFDTIDELDAVSQIGPSTLKKLKEAARARGYLDAQEAKDREVVFSPQPIEASHTAAIAQAIRGAKRTVDVAMYSYSDAAIGAALTDAVARGVKVRFLFDTASEDRKLTGAALAATKSGRLEAAGIDVRWVNKIMHHKFTIIDGPREDAAFAEGASLITGSGNWSNGAATKYDENTVFLTAYPELSLRFQREFDHLWSHSRDVASNPAIVSDITVKEIAEEAIPEDPGMHVYFTSDNFTAVNDGFTGNRKNTISDVLVEAIGRAEKRIHVASGHLRSRPVSEALMARKAEDPDLDVRVYLDGQEYISQSSHDQQVADLDVCVAAATTESKKASCLDKGFLFGLAVGQADIDVRYKYYAYRWDASYAPQMHNKYLIVDDELFTGSYNLSDNAEHATFENMLHFRGPEFVDLVEEFEARFDVLWKQGDGLLEGFRTQVDTQATFPILFPAMSLSWQEVRDLKSLIAAECPAVNSEEFRANPTSHQSCTK